MSWLRRLLRTFAPQRRDAPARPPTPEDRHDEDDEPDEHDEPGDPGPDAVRLDPSDTIDLHSFRPADVASVVEEFLEAALAAGFREVRIVHGKGTGVQRGIVRKVLERHPGVVSYSDASDASGWGATIARLGGTSRPANDCRSPYP